MRRKGSLIRFVKPAAMPPTSETKKRKVPPDDNFYLQVAPNARARCIICERPIHKGAFEVTRLKMDNKRKRVVCMHMKCADVQIDAENDKDAKHDFLNKDERAMLRAERRKLHHDTTETT